MIDIAHCLQLSSHGLLAEKQEPSLKEGLLVTELTSTENRTDDRLEAMMDEFEQNNPELSAAIQTLGVTVNEYERMLTQSRSIEIQTSNSTGGAVAS